MKRNKFSKALKHLKSKKIDEKIKLLDESPTNNMKGVYQVTPDTGDGFRMGIEDPVKRFYPKADGTWPSGIPANATDRYYDRAGGYYEKGKGVVDAVQNNTPRDLSLAYMQANGNDTTTMIRASDGMVYADLPEGTRSFILGPLVTSYTQNHVGFSNFSPDDFTNLGYIQKDTRQFVLLGRIEGFLDGAKRANGAARTWDGTAAQFTSYNSNFKLEHALWMKERYNEGNFTANVPFNLSGGIPADRHPDDNSKGGGDLLGSAAGLAGGDNDNIGTKQGPPDDNDINSLNLMGLNINPEDIFDPTTAAQKARLGLNILRAFTDAARFGGSDFIFKGLSKNTTYFPEFTGASNIKFRGKTIPKIADWNRLFKAMAGKNYASQYFTPDLGTALKYGGEGGSIVAIPRTPGVRGWKNWFGSNVSRGFDPRKGVEQLVRTSDAIRLRGATKIFNTADKKSMEALTKLATKGAKTSRVLKTAGRLVPFANLGLVVTDVSMRLAQGDYAGAFLGGVSGIPGPIGWLALGGQVAYDELGGKDLMNSYYGPKIQAVVNANKAANQSVSSSAERRAARGGGDRNEFGQNVKVSEPRPAKPSGNAETAKIDLEIAKIKTKMSGNVSQYEKNRLKQQLNRAKQRLSKANSRLDADHKKNVQNWEARRDARGSSYKPPRSIYQGAFKGLGDDATPSTPDPDPAPPKFEPEPQGSFGGGQGNPTNPRGSGAKPRPKPEPKPKPKPEKDYERNRRRNRPKFQRNDFTLNGNLLSEEKEGSVNFDGMGKAMIEMGLPEKKEDFVKEMGVLYALEGEINPQLLSMLLMAIAGEEFSDEQKKWLDSNLVPFIGGYANKVEKEQGGEEVKESIITDETKKRILREVRQPLREIQELPKTTKLKGYRPNFKGRFSPQNTPDVTASKISDDIVSAKNSSRQIWTAKDKFWKGYETTERMNIIYDNLGHGDQYFDRIVGENLRQKSKKSRDVQEHLNMLQHQKAMREVYGIKEYEKMIDESETFDNKINDPLFSKVAKRLKKEIDYPKKPAKAGYPNEAPPKIDPNTGMHPKFGKRYKYDKLDPISARTMAGAPTGDPEIDANVKKAAKIKENWRSDLKNLWLGSEREEWKKKLEEGMTTSDTFSYSVSGKGDVDLITTGTGFTQDGIHQLQNIEPMTNVSDPTNAGKKFGKTHGYNNTYGGINQYDSQSKEDAGIENIYYNAPVTGPLLDDNTNLRFSDYIYPFDRDATQAETDIGKAATKVRGNNDSFRAVYPTNVIFTNAHKATPVVTNATVGTGSDYNTAGLAIQFGHGADTRDPRFFVPNPVNASEIDTVQILASLPDSDSITSAGSQLQLFYWSGDKPGFQSLYPANVTSYPFSKNQNDGWRPIAMKPNGETDSSVNSNLIDIEKPADYLGPDVINKFSIQIPEWVRSTSTRFMFVQVNGSGSRDNLRIYSIGYQRRNAITINTTLSDEKASAYVRVGNNSQMSPEERKKKLNDMLKASREYMLKSLGFASLFNDEVKISDVVSNTFDYQAVMQGSGAFGNTRFNDLVSLEKRQAMAKKYRARPKTKKRSGRFRGYQRTGRDSKGMTTRARVNPNDIIGSI